MGESDYLVRAKQLFLDELRGHLSYLSSALEATELDYLELYRRFHLLKGGAGFLALSEIENIARRGEALAQSEQCTGLAALKSELEKCYADLKT